MDAFQCGRFSAAAAPGDGSAFFSLCVAATSERLFFLSLCCLFVSAIAFVQEEKRLSFVEKWSHSCTITVPSVISAKWKILQTNKKKGSFSFFFFLA